jgi:RNA polymerase sigma-70 factor (ECF subfamily)
MPTPVPIPVPDAVLVRQIAQGDLAAHRELCARYRLFVYAEAYAILWDAALAELAAAEAFQEVCRSAGHFDPGAGTAVAWLSRITRTVALRRRASVRDLPIQSPAPSESVRGERGAHPL